MHILLMSLRLVLQGADTEQLVLLGMGRPFAVAVGAVCTICGLHDLHDLQAAAAAAAAAAVAEEEPRHGAAVPVLEDTAPPANSPQNRHLVADLFAADATAPPAVPPTHLPVDARVDAGARILEEWLALSEEAEGDQPAAAGPEVRHPNGCCVVR